jgi:hypothetical protein
MTIEQWEASWTNAPTPAPNSCVNCRFELTCGYSGLAMSGRRTEPFSYGPCVLGEKSFGAGPFFQAR